MYFSALHLRIDLQNNRTHTATARRGSPVNQYAPVIQTGKTYRDVFLVNYGDYMNFLAEMTNYD
jgi:hypothetical protein